MEKLEAIAMNDEMWSAAAMEVTTNETNTREQIQASGRQIIDCVLTDRLSLKDLRSCAQWTGILAREAAAAREDSHRLDDEERLEIIARQIMHGSVSTALKEVRTQGRVVTQRARRLNVQRRQSNDMPGMGRGERKDLEVRADFAEQAQ